MHSCCVPKPHALYGLSTPYLQHRILLSSLPLQVPSTKDQGPDAVSRKKKKPRHHRHSERGRFSHRRACYYATLSALEPSSSTLAKQRRTETPRSRGVMSTDSTARNFGRTVDGHPPIRNEKRGSAHPPKRRAKDSLPEGMRKSGPVLSVAGHDNL